MFPLNIRKKIISYIYKKVFKKKTAIAFSGGIDSSILLNICKRNKKLTVIYVNHNLSKHSGKWGCFCKKVARKNKLRFKSIDVTISKKNIKKFGLEGAARIKRYSSISKYMKKNKIKNLLTAHHLDDCVETYILKFFRGCGIRGLKSIKKKKKIFNITVFRPLISLSRSDLIYIFEKPKKYINDPSNYNMEIKRNMLRNVLNKYIYKNFPNLKEIVPRNIKNYENEIELLNYLAKRDIKRTGLILSRISNLKKNRIINIILFIFKRKRIGIPSRRWIIELVKQIKKKKKSMIVEKKNVKIFIRNDRLIIHED
ncbi:tRNA(Ile)-lysidine synthase [Candidatus Vidania fulgoroideae]|nr:tRNA(Ile)-lysidine synthase [Candidatus Vidania fulgoroideae]